MIFRAVTKRSVSASNRKFSKLSEDNTSTVKLLYNSARKSFARGFLFWQKTVAGQQETEMKQGRLNLS